MIRYDMECDACGHAYDGWWKDSATWERLAAGGLLTCPACGSARVRKALMAPAVHSRTETPRPAPASDVKAVLRAVRRSIERNFRNVGSGFAAEARRLHETGEPGRIYGDATPEEIRRLTEDGIPVGQVPWVPLDDA
jgi:hypothetical protein